MILIQTKLKKIPDTCTKCKFFDHEIFGGWDAKRICSITRTEVPLVFVKEKNNWCYTKCNNCPLVEVKQLNN